MNQSLIAAATGLAVIAQASLLLSWEEMSARSAIQTATGLAALGLLTALLRWNRNLLPRHADMLLLMSAFGGLGMALAAMRGEHTHAAHASAGDPLRMTVAMILFGAVPVTLWSRCLEGCDLSERVGIAAMDCTAMTFAMQISHQALAGAGHIVPLGHHLLMVLAMAAAMSVATATRISFARLAPNVPFRRRIPPVQLKRQLDE